MSGVSLDAFDTVTKANEGVEIELTHVATGKPMGCFVTVHGMDSDRFQAARAAREQRARDLLTRPGKDSLTEEESFDLRVEFLAALVGGWRNLDQGGKPLEYSHAAALSLLRTYPAIRDQIDRAAANRGNFLLA